MDVSGLHAVAEERHTQVDAVLERLFSLAKERAKALSHMGIDR